MLAVLPGSQLYVFDVHTHTHTTAHNPATGKNHTPLFGTNERESKICARDVERKTAEQTSEMGEREKGECSVYRADRAPKLIGENRRKEINLLTLY